MKVLRIIAVCILLFSFVFSCSNETTDDIEISQVALDASVVYEETDIAYGTDVRQKFDLYLPANRTSTTKTVILIHGGGWSSGDKSDMTPVFNLIKNELPDLAIVTMNYRFADADNSPYPMQLEDISILVNFLKTNKMKYFISENIGFIGTSAGGHLALLWSYGFDTNNRVDMVCSIVGPTDFTDPAYVNNSTPEIREILNVFGANPPNDFLRLASPLHQARSTSPPTILFYGGMDSLIPTSQGTRLRDKLQELGVTHEFTLYPNAGHGWEGLELLDTWSKLKVYMETYL